MHDEMIKIGKIIRDARKAKGMTPPTLSKATGITVRTIIDLEKDKRLPKLEVFNSIVRALDIPTDQIFRPDKVAYTLQEEQLLFELRSYNEKDRTWIMEAMSAFIRTEREEN